MLALLWESTIKHSLQVKETNGWFARTLPVTARSMHQYYMQQQDPPEVATLFGPRITLTKPDCETFLACLNEDACNGKQTPNATAAAKEPAKAASGGSGLSSGKSE